MSLITYTNGDRQSSPRRRLFGTAHAGSDWTTAVRLVRAAIHNALPHGDWRRSSVTADTVGTAIIDRISELDTASLHVLAVVFGILVKASRQ